MPAEWYVQTPDGKEYGPYSGAMLKQFADEGRVQRRTQIEER